MVHGNARFRRASRAGRRRGRWHNAARVFVLARDFARAARLYEQLKAWPDAAHIYEEAGDFTEEVRIRLPPELVALAQDAGEHPVKGRGQPVHVFTMRPE